MAPDAITAPRDPNHGTPHPRPAETRKNVRPRLTVFSGIGARFASWLGLLAAAFVAGPLVMANDFIASGAMVMPRTTFTATRLADGKVLAAGGFNSSNGILPSAEIYDPSTGTWAATGELSTARGDHTATLLDDGKVLIAGGGNFSGEVSTAELYDPATGTWSDTGSMSVGRPWATATLLMDGKVLVAGGAVYGAGGISSAELFDPATGTWTPTGSMISERYQHRAVLLNSGQVLVVGGSGDDSAEIYDPATGIWTATSPLNNGGRSVSTLSLLPSGLALTTGGYANDTAELFDPATGEWTPTASMASARASHTATVLNNGKVIVTGGLDAANHVLASAELYDPAAGTWTTIDSLNAIRTHHAATLLDDGRVLIAGGDDDAANNQYASTELYSPGISAVPDTWTATGSLGFNRSRHSATLLNDGTVLVAGGVDLNGTPLASAELYNPAAGVWIGTGALHSPHSNHTATLLPDGKVLIAGGRADNISGVSVAAAEIYDPQTGEWAITGPLAAARQNHTATLLPGGAVLVAGGLGINNYNTLDSAERYDPASGAWTATIPLIHARSQHTATLLNDGRVLVAGGSDSLKSELYDPATELWTDAGQIILNTFGHTATLLANGKVLLAGGEYVAGPLLMTSNRGTLYDPATASWTATGSMAIGHESHTATRLSDGRVLVAGLGYASGSPNSAELYDPGTGIWATAAALIAPRGHHTATLLPGGQVLVAGGYGVNIGSAAELYGVVPATAIVLTNPTRLPDGSFQFGFSAAAGSGHTVLATEDLTIPHSGWRVLGSAAETSPGQFQFTDTDASNHVNRFYIVSTP